MDIISETIFESLIMPYLRIKDLGVLGKVSRLWNKICNNNEIWKYHYLRIPPIPSHSRSPTYIPAYIPSFKDLFWTSENVLLEINKIIILNYKHDRDN